jgi:hypothetical protein
MIQDRDPGQGDTDAPAGITQVRTLHWSEPTQVASVAISSQASPSCFSATRVPKTQLA